MDYPFFIWKIAQLSDGLLDQLEQAIRQSDGWKIAEGFSPKHGLAQIGLDEGLLNGVSIELAHLFPPGSYVQSRINRLPAGRTVSEHSDVEAYGTTGNYGWQCLSQHCVHVPIVTNPGVVSWHRRTKHAPFFSGWHMPRGAVCLYNNVPWHMLENTGTEDRYHLWFKVQDKPDFSLKNSLLHKANVPRTYEATASNLQDYRGLRLSAREKDSK